MCRLAYVYIGNSEVYMFVYDYARLVRSELLNGEITGLEFFFNQSTLLAILKSQCFWRANKIGKEICPKC